MIPTDNEISHFLQVYTEQHLTRAAVRLRISQPALTQSIVRLESKLKTKLFVRTKRGCQPTNAAKLLFAKANRLMECWADIENTVFASDKTLQGKFRIGCHPSVGAYTLPRFVRAVEQAAPLVEFQLVHAFSREVVEKVIRSEVDFGFVINPVRHPDLVLVKMGTDRLCFWKSGRVKQSPRIVFSDLSSYEMKRTFRGPALKSISEWKNVETPSLELIRTLVIQGAGIGFLPERVAQADEGDVERIDELPMKHDEIFLAYRSDALKSVAGRVLINAAKSCIST